MFEKYLYDFYILVYFKAETIFFTQNKTHVFTFYQIKINFLLTVENSYNK